MEVMLPFDVYYFLDARGIVVSDPDPMDAAADGYITVTRRRRHCA